MLEYVHFVPGRLRLVIRELKDRRRAAEAEAYVSAIPVVKSAVANPITGSLTIHFDARKLSIDGLWEKLRSRCYVSGRCPKPTAIGSFSIDNAGADRRKQAIMSAVLEALIQHSAQALVRALL
jgi:Heavy metal associated domain 2